jgi:hypothetical protein
MPELQLLAPERTRGAPRVGTNRPRAGSGHRGFLVHAHGCNPGHVSEPAAEAGSDNARLGREAAQFIAARWPAPRQYGSPSLSASPSPSQARRTLDDLLAAADHALYQAKSSGRDRVVIYADTWVPQASQPLALAHTNVLLV